MSREEAIEILSDMRAEYNLFGDEKEATRYHVLSWAIKEMKAIQPERKIGRWFVLDECANEGIYCSECHKKVFKIDYSNTMKWKNFKFCPHCGADMRGEQNETD